jgi:hypothetical protein
MDWWVIVLRIVHVGAAMLWFGGAILSAFFLDPTERALGRQAQPFMEHLMTRRKLGIYFPIVALLTILAGAALYWHASGGLQAAWVASPTGLAFTLGGLAAIAAFISGMVLLVPAVSVQTAVGMELAATDAGPTPAQLERLAWADRRMRLATWVDIPLLLFAALTMAVARYL